ncbi:XdhC family protein [Candidatus Halocynthiibacter alkanivorans]|uniref:XdhC family protein n=1 Tax=Candidatus Halocynthiibacter alkanivorans TaxID=2267619 RepID=UPI000DF32355|nr:XdhC family protein [Candidatus Halocynthiibacter alkanivorans]
MNTSDMLEDEITGCAHDLRKKGTAFAIATVVRTVDATSVKPGAKALLLQDGEVLEGWIGGGCVRGAIARAAVEALREGTPRLISLRPEEVLEREGLRAGDRVDGVEYARNGCPSKGSMDIFIEPVLPKPVLMVLGNSPVALALAELAAAFEFQVTVEADPGTPEDGAETPDTAGSPDTPGLPRRFIVVASQGKGDQAHLKRALDLRADYIAFVGSKRKFSTLVDKLVGQGADREPLQQIVAPAGLDIQAVTPKEIALSILAQVVQRHRQGHRQGHRPDTQQNPHSEG